MSLIELMIAIVLGMLVVAAAGSIFIANKNAYRATESLGRVQENSRLAFELMARDIREASGSACNSTIKPANMLNAPIAWWSKLTTDGVAPNGLQGYENGALAGSLAGTDAIQLVSATGGNYAITKMTTSIVPIALTTTTHDLVTSDILLVCDFGCATIFQTTSAANGSSAIAHAAAGTPGNRGNWLECNAGDATHHRYGVDAVVGRVRASQWYVANNAAGGKSLFTVQFKLGVAQTPEEIVEGVTDLQLTYLIKAGAAYQTATAIDASNSWKDVVAVQINLTLLGNDKVGPNGELLTRTLSNVVYMRNQSP